MVPPPLMEWKGILCLDSRPVCLPVGQPEFPQITPWSRAPAQPLKNQDPGALLVISGGKTSLLLVAVQTSIGCNAGADP